MTSITRTSLLNSLCRDLAVVGFERQGKKLLCNNEELSVEITVDVIHEAMDPSNPTRQVDITFRVMMHDLTLQDKQLGLPVFWIGTGWFSRYDIMEQSGPREPYLFPSNRGYENSQLAQDVRDFGVDFFASITTRQNFLDYILCRPVAAGRHTITRPLGHSRNALALSLVISDALHDSVRAQESLAKLKQYDALSHETHKNMQALVSKISSVGELVERYDKKFYESLIES